MAVTATPDAITQDGSSVSTISVVARDANGQLLGNRSFRLDMMVNGKAADFGTLSSRTITTSADGRATAVYTAPAAPPAGAVAGTCDGGSGTAALGGSCIQIVATSLGSDYSAAASHVVQIRLVPSSVIVAASSVPSATFSVATPTPTNNSPVLFDASASCAVQPDAGVCSLGGGTITSYSWSFGDGSSGSGRTASHTYTRQQTFLVTLTVTNDRGVTSVPFSLPVQIGAGSLPTASFTSSPTAPVVGASCLSSTARPRSRASATRSSSSSGTGVTAQRCSSRHRQRRAHRYSAEGSYVVTLNVTDESGQTGTVTATVKVALPTP